MPPYLNNILMTLQPFIVKNSAQQSEAISQLSTSLVKSPTLSPVATTMVNNLGAQAAVLQASSANAKQGVSVSNMALAGTQQLIELNKNMQALCIQAVNGTSDHRVIQQSLHSGVIASQSVIDSTAFSTQPLFSGGEVAQAPFPTTETALTILGGNPTAQTSFVNGLIIPASCVGKIEGQTTSVTVTPNGTNQNNVNVSLSIGPEIYAGEDLSLGANTPWNLRSAGGSILTLQIGGTTIPHAAQAQTDLETVLGLQAGDAPAVFVPGSGAQNPALTVNLSPQATPGVYGMGIANIGGVLTLSVSNGTTGSTVNLTGVNAGGTFALPALPGLSVTFGATPAATPNTLFEVKNNLNLEFQTGPEPQNKTALSIPKTTLTSLHYVDMDVLTLDAARRTLDKLKEGASVLNSNLAMIGNGQQKLVTAGSFAEILGKNVQDARNAYVDARPMTALENLEKSSEALAKALAGLAVALATQKQMGDMIQQMMMNMA